MFVTLLSFETDDYSLKIHVITKTIFNSIHISFNVHEFRSDGHKDFFGTCNMMSMNSCNIWSILTYTETYSTIKKGGTYMRKNQRKVSLYLFGSTIGAAKFPLYFDGITYHTLPRPYANYKPNSLGRQIIDSTWFKDFVVEIEDIIFYFLRNLYPENKKAKITLYLMEKARKVIPLECRIAGTFFNHMSLLGNLNDEVGDIEPHTDNDDIITALFHVGNPSSGGGTSYYSGLSKKDKGNTYINVPFQHGRLQIGFFNNIVHSGDTWTGVRGGINLNLKKSVLEFFSKPNLNRYYVNYRNAGFPIDYIGI